MATHYNEEEGSYEKIIRFYFLYEILKEFIFYKKIS